MAAFVPTQTQLQLLLSWTGTSARTGYKSVRVNDNLTILSYPASATYNRMLIARYSLAASAVQVIDLASFPDLYDPTVTVTLTKAAGLAVKSNGQAFRIEPNGSNPLQWFFGTSSYLVLGASEGFGVLSAVTFTTGSKLKLTNTGGSIGTFDVAISGGT